MLYSMATIIIVAVRCSPPTSQPHPSFPHILHDDSFLLIFIEMRRRSALSRSSALAKETLHIELFESSGQVYYFKWNMSLDKYASQLLNQKRLLLRWAEATGDFKAFISRPYSYGNETSFQRDSERLVVLYVLDEILILFALCRGLHYLLLNREKTPPSPLFEHSILMIWHL